MTNAMTNAITTDRTCRTAVPRTKAVRTAIDALRAYAQLPDRPEPLPIRAYEDALENHRLASEDAALRVPASKAVVDAFAAEIRRRGGEDVLETDAYPRGTRSSLRSFTHRLEVIEVDAQQRMAVLRVSDWHQTHPKYPGTLVTIAYLVGVGDNGLWAARIPGTVDTVTEALKALTPAEVQKREHVRQGDVYLVRMERKSATTPDGVVRDSHLWDAEARTLTHQPEDGRAHKAVTAPAAWPGVKVVEQHRFEFRGFARD